MSRVAVLLILLYFHLCLNVLFKTASSPFRIILLEKFYLSITHTISIFESLTIYCLIKFHWTSLFQSCNVHVHEEIELVTWTLLLTYPVFFLEKWRALKFPLLNTYAACHLNHLKLILMSENIILLMHILDWLRLSSFRARQTGCFIGSTGKYLSMTT